MTLLSLVIRACHKSSPQKISFRFLHDKTADYTVVNGGIIIDQLKSLSVPFKEGFTCIHVKKCICLKGKSGSGDSTDVFINKRTGFFLCERCKVAGDWESYKNILTDVKVNKTYVKSLKESLKYDSNISEWDNVVEKTDSLRHLTNEDCEEIFNEFKLIRFSKTIIENLDVRISKDKSMLYFPLKCSEFVVGYKTLKKNWEENVSPRIDCPGLLSSRKSENAAAAAVVVGGIPDFLALAALNFRNYEIVCLPYGATYLPQMCLPFFEKYKKIILWLGENCLDKTGNIVRKLNDKRCYLVKLTENQKSASVALSQNLCIKDILNEAKLTYHQYVTTFSSFRDDILIELQNHSQIVGIPWENFPALTDILKGHRRGEMTILSGPTGVGKTTFLSQYSLDLAKQGVYTLWGSFEVKNIRLAKIMLTQFAEAPLPKNLTKYNELCDRFECLPLFFLAFHGQQNIKNVMDAVYHCSYTYDIAHVIIDNVQFMIEVLPDSNNLDRFSKQDYMIQMFRSFASRNNCHVTLVMHPKKVDGLDLDANSIFGGVKASQEADNILIIQKSVSEYGMKKSLEVVKNRFSGDLGSFPLYFDKSTLSFRERKKIYENPKEDFHSYSDKYENDNENYGKEWENKSYNEELDVETEQEDEFEEEEEVKEEYEKEEEEVKEEYEKEEEEVKEDYENEEEEVKEDYEKEEEEVKEDDYEKKEKQEDYEKEDEEETTSSLSKNIFS